MSLALKLVKARKAGYGPMVNPMAPGRGVMQYGGPRMYSMQRRGQQGGIFGDIGKFLAGAAGSLVGGIPVVGGLISAPLKAIAGGALDKKKAGVVGSSSSVSVASFAPTGPGMSSPMPTMPQLTGGGSYAPEQSYPVSTAGGSSGTAVARCAPSGYHLNKSGYWKNTSDLMPGASWQEPGTVLVRNRKRNPYNPKAASRAMSRLAALSQGMKTLERQLTKLAPKRRTSSRSCGPKCKSK